MKHTVIAIIAAVVASASLGCAAFEAPCARVAPVSLEGPRPLTVRAEGGTLWTSSHRWAEPRRTWAFPTRGPVRDIALRVLPAEHGYEITFRQGDITWRGEVDRERSARGPLQAVSEPADRDGATVITAQR